MDNAKIYLEYTETIEIQRYEKENHIVKEYNNIPLNIIKAIETLLENCKKEV